MAFVTFQLNEMHKALCDRFGNGIMRDREEENQVNACEVIFAVPTAHHRVDILVYTTYVPGKRESRGYADDAVKFVIRYKGKTATRYVGKLAKVHRTMNGTGKEGFFKRVADTIEKLADMAVPLTPCDCGSLLVPRYISKKRRYFLGCLEYPECKGSKNL